MDNEDFIHLLENNMSPEDFNKFIKSLEREEERNLLSEQMDIILNRLESEYIDSFATYDRDIILQKLNKKLRKKKIQKYAVSASIMIAIFILGVVSSFMVNQYKENHENIVYESLSVSRGENPVHVIFQDGSEIIVNSGSELRYPVKFNKKNRCVSLEGEAYFDIATVKNNNFKILLGNSEIAVKGTSFNVKNYPSDSLTIVSLDKGSIDFICNGNSYLIKPNEQLVYNHLRESKPIITKDVLTSRNSLWKSNIIAFDKTPMIEVLNTISKIYNVSYNIMNQEVLTYSFTYTSSSSQGNLIPLDSLLNDLEIISEIRFILNNNSIEVYK